MDPLEPNQFQLILNYVHNAREDLARAGKYITQISTTYSVITDKITDISFRNPGDMEGMGLVKHFSTRFVGDTHYTNLYDMIMDWLTKKEEVHEKV